MSTNSKDLVEAQDGSRLRTRRCHFFFSKKGCNQGDNCRFSHDIKQNGSPVKPQSVQQLGSGEASSADILKSCDHDIDKGKATPKVDSKPEPSISESSCNSKEDKKKAKSRRRGGQLGNKDGQKKSQPDEVCHYFLRKGQCHFGARCRFAHVERSGSDEYTESRRARAQGKLSEATVTSNTPTDETKEDDAKGPVKSDKKGSKAAQKSRQREKKRVPLKERACRYFRAGDCRQGEHCKFLHPANIEEASSKDEVMASESKKEEGNCQEEFHGTPITDSAAPVNPKIKESAYPKYIPPNRRPTELSIDSITLEDKEHLRCIEIQQMKKRFPHLEELVEGRSYGITFVPSDPDWPYDFKETLLVISFSRDYPFKPLRVSIPRQENLPQVVGRFLRRDIMEWLLKRHEAFEKAGKVELVFRPFLRWLDKNIEKTFTEGLKQYKRELMAREAGIEIVPTSALRDEYPADLSHDEDDEEDEDTGDDSVGTGSEDGCSAEESEEEPPETVLSLPGAAGAGTNVVRRGTEVKLAHLQLMDNASTLMVQKLVVVLQCNRCKHRTELSTPAHRANSLSCPKCHFGMMASLRASMAHQYTSVIGYLDLQDCTAFDLILSNCDFIVGCFHCSKEMKLQGIFPGQMKETWCLFCHSKMRVSTENARFVQLQPADISSESGPTHVVAVQKIRKVPKDPAIREGFPLPNHGTCKHYKKSFRWLRFPCCGKAYPCDVCHDENEDGHEMKFANRMICGYCCKEQPYSAEKACSGCGSDVTRKFSSHWEGGKGCRNVVKMSRNDDHKFAGSNKTISKKAQNKSTGGKKRTKLRHS